MALMAARWIFLSRRMPAFAAFAGVALKLLEKIGH
jgi:hypothetical protein